MLQPHTEHAFQFQGVRVTNPNTFRAFCFLIGKQKAGAQHPSSNQASECSGPESRNLNQDCRFDAKADSCSVLSQPLGPLLAMAGGFVLRDLVKVS
jgi:hypothetical protein